MTVYNFEVSANASSTASQSKFVIGGVMKELSILFPKGCNGLAHLRIYANNEQIIPLTPTSYIAGDGESVNMSPYSIINAGTLLKVENENTDDTYTHTIQVRVNIVPEEQKRIDVPNKKPSLLERILRVFR